MTKCFNDNARRLTDNIVTFFKKCTKIDYTEYQGTVLEVPFL